LAIIKTVN